MSYLLVTSCSCRQICIYVMCDIRLDGMLGVPITWTRVKKTLKSGVRQKKSKNGDLSLYAVFMNKVKIIKPNSRSQ